MDELKIGEEVYISTKRAARVTGYAKDYIGQLCREGRVEAKLVGRSWYVREESLRGHRFGEGEETPTVAEEDRAMRFMGVTYTPETASSLPELVKAEPMENNVEPSVAADVPTELEVSGKKDEETHVPIVHIAVQRPGAMDVVSSRVRHKQPIQPSVSRRQDYTSRLNNQNQWQGSYLVLKAAMIAIAILVVSLAALGTGKFDSNIMKSDQNLFFSFIRGVSVFSRN